MVLCFALRRQSAVSRPHPLIKPGEVMQFRAKGSWHSGLLDLGSIRFVGVYDSGFRLRLKRVLNLWLFAGVQRVYLTGSGSFEHSGMMDRV